jgi:hypothetical protein
VYRFGCAILGHDCYTGAQFAPARHCYAWRICRHRAKQAIAAADDLVRKCTTIFDGFRAPMSAQERARRLDKLTRRYSCLTGPQTSSQSEMNNLDRWGYPYLFQDFRFHMTLTGQLPIARRAMVLIPARDMRRFCHWSAYSKPISRIGGGGRDTADTCKLRGQTTDRLCRMRGGRTLAAPLQRDGVCYPAAATRPRTRRWFPDWQGDQLG